MLGPLGPLTAFHLPLRKVLSAGKHPWKVAFCWYSGLESYENLAELGYFHTAVAQRGDMQVAETFLPIIHLVFSNLKTWLRGTHHGVSPQHLSAYRNEFTFRFNRRFYPLNAFRSLLGIAGDITVPAYAELCAAKSRATTI